MSMTMRITKARRRPRVLGLFWPVHSVSCRSRAWARTWCRRRRARAKRRSSSGPMGMPRCRDPPAGCRRGMLLCCWRSSVMMVCWFFSFLVRGTAKRTRFFSRIPRVVRVVVLQLFHVLSFTGDALVFNQSDMVATAMYLQIHFGTAQLQYCESPQLQLIPDMLQLMSTPEFINPCL